MKRPLKTGETVGVIRRRQRVILLAVLAMGVIVCWLGATDDVRVWPVRNTLQYHLTRRWWSVVGTPLTGTAAAKVRETGSIEGVVHDPAHRPVDGAIVLLTDWDGTTYRAVSDLEGRYRLTGVPAGDYAAVVGKPGYAPEVLDDSRRRWWPWQPVRRVAIEAGGTRKLDAPLSAARSTPAPSPGTEVELGPPLSVTTTHPIPAEAIRRTISFRSGDRWNQAAYAYEPAPSASAPTSASWPVLLTVYPGPAGEWEAASVPLAAAGYVVVAAGPAYSFEIERDVDELVRLLQLARAGGLPATDGTRVAVLGGSYSALHVLRLLQRDHAPAAAVLMGAPSDLFDLRRRLEDGTFIPPFGLDQALIALGFPDREPLRYWRYSGTYHAGSVLPPVLLVHSRSDDVVPYQQSVHFADALSSAGVSHRLYLLEGGSHYLLSVPENAQTILALTVTFLRTFLR